MTKPETDLQLRRKKILWRANHRGMKEMDLMLGGYAVKNLEHMSPVQLDEFEAILEISDAVLNAWLTDKSETPVELQTQMFAEIKAQSFVSGDYTKF